MEALLRARDVARLLSIQPATVYSLVDRGVIPHIRLTKGARRSLIRFRPEDIQRLIRERSSLADPTEE